MEPLSAHSIYTHNLNSWMVILLLMFFEIYVYWIVDNPHFLGTSYDRSVASNGILFVVVHRRGISEVRKYVPTLYMLC
jgi:hypothetical protein